MSQNPKLGSALTFCQLVFIALGFLPNFVVVDKQSFPPRIGFKPRHVPIRLWALCVILLTSVSLLNNWAFAFHVPVSIQILIRAAGTGIAEIFVKVYSIVILGLGVAMCFGYIFMKKRYTKLQVVRDELTPMR